MGKRKVRQSETLIHSHEDDEFRDQRSEDPEDDNDKSGFFACYLLTSLCPRYKGHTYIGFTVNPRRRIRQHNGELCSGAWRTKKKRPWEMVLCIYGFPTNTAALQFEWAWQHPVESLAVRKAAVGFKSLGGLANKIKLAYTMLTLPAWNNLNLNVNFFSSKYTKHYAGCPMLPSHMRVYIRSMDELPCYTEGYKEDDDDDMFGFANDPSDHDDDDDEEPGKANEDILIPVLSSTNHHSKGEEETCISGTGIYEPSCSNKDPWDDDKESETIPVSASADLQNKEKEAICVSDDENFKQPSCTNKDLWDDDEELETVSISVSADNQNNEKEAICVSDDENYEQLACSNMPKISGASVEVEVVDLFTPSPEYRNRKRRGVSVVCPEIIDLTEIESPICV